MEENQELSTTEEIVDTESSPSEEVTDEEIVIEVKTRQFSKQDCPNEVTDEGIVMKVKPLQS